MVRVEKIRSAPWVSILLVNGITFSRLIAGTLSVVWFASITLKPYLTIIVAYIFASDLLDGYLARRFSVTTKIGAIFDYVVDRLNYYLVICILIHQGVSPLLFTPFFLRDLIDLGVQAYISLPKIRGTKPVSFVGTASVYLYVLWLNYGNERKGLLETILFLALSLSLSNMLVRIRRLKIPLKAALDIDIASLGSKRPL